MHIVLSMKIVLQNGAVQVLRVDENLELQPLE